MKDWQSATLRRKFMAVAVAIALGCTSTVDNLGTDRAGIISSAGSMVGGGVVTTAAGTSLVSAAGQPAAGGILAIGGASTDRTAAGGTPAGGMPAGGMPAGGMPAGGTSPGKPAAGGTSASSTSSSNGRIKTTLGTLPCPASYPNPYRDIGGHKPADIKKKISDAFAQLLGGDPDTEAIYFDVGTDQGVIRDVLHNNEVRTEGMGLVLLALATRDDGREKFDRLWRYVRKNLEYTSGPMQGYFKSRCDETSTTTSTATRECVDPYGMQQFAMALLMARQRWVPSPSMPDYGDEAARLLDVMRNGPNGSRPSTLGGAGAAGQSALGVAGRSSGPAFAGGGGYGGTVSASPGGPLGAGGSGSSSGSSGASGNPASAGASATASSTGGASSNGATGEATPTFDPKTRLIYFEPNTTVASAFVTGTSMEMPGYYSIWAQVTGDSFYEEAANAARNYLRGIANPKTGLFPVRATFDGKQVENWNAFTAEAYRVLPNLVIDRLWGNSADWQIASINALLKFFLSQGFDDYGSAYSLDGEKAIGTNHAPELVLLNGVIASISTIADADRKKFIEAAWGIAVPTDKTRYYPGILHLLGNLILAGELQLCPR